MIVTSKSANTTDVQQLAVEFDQLLAAAAKAHVDADREFTLVAIPTGLRFNQCDKDPPPGEPRPGEIREGMFYWSWARCRLIGAALVGGEGPFRFLAFTEKPLAASALFPTATLICPSCGDHIAMLRERASPTSCQRCKKPLLVPAETEDLSRPMTFSEFSRKCIQFQIRAMKKASKCNPEVEWAVHTVFSDFCRVEPEPNGVRILRHPWAASHAVLEHISRTARLSELAAPKPDTTKKKGQDIDGQMLKELDERPESVNWSGQQWADFLGCAKSTVTESKTWKNRILTARALLAAESAGRMDQSRTHRRGRLKPQHKSQSDG